ncbi:MAG TPA: sigma-70 family RNA polymerase sigma factor [Nitriliruptorales bacterium]
MEEPDPVMIRAAAAGDLDAFERLVRRYQEPVWRFLRGLVSDRALAEDLAQETFLRAFDRLDSFGFRSRFSTWLFQIARNLAVDSLRRRERRRALPWRVGPNTEPPGPDLGTELASAVSSLSPKLREALLLVEVMGFSCIEAGAILGIPDGTVKSRLFHARRQLVEWFEADDDGQVHGEV